MKERVFSRMKLTAIVLTYNEGIHLERCLTSLYGVVEHIVVVDCFSTDMTLDIARAHGARVIQKPWINHANQFNWALTQLAKDTEWVLRIDADEVLTPMLALEIRERLPSLSYDIHGICFSRRMTFQGRMIRWGGIFPVRVLRMFRYGRGECENRWMDEHIKVSGLIHNFNGEIIDDNLNTLSWWINKHNGYASREAVDILNMEYGFMPYDSVADLRGGQAGVKRWLKEQVYFRLPVGLRAGLYFFYRYLLRLGFLDGQEGFAFHFMQGFWYRYLVDAKVTEVKRIMRERGWNVVEAVERVLGIRVTDSSR